jgi:D-inositol-3-phosphate glycosyltransferase
MIRTLMALNGRLAARCLALGPYLCHVAGRYCPRTEMTHYYGVDTDLFRPGDEQERAAIRRKWDLPKRKFLIFFASRVSHEKDPETVLRAAHLARGRGLDAVVLNLGGGYQEFLQLARDLALPDVQSWVLGGPAAHPMRELADIYRAADVVAQASLEEGLGLSPLEALASGTPVVATAVGGMAGHLRGYARLTPRSDAAAMAQQFLWVAASPQAARSQAVTGREYVKREWDRGLAFAGLRRALMEVVARGGRAVGAIKPGAAETCGLAAFRNSGTGTALLRSGARLQQLTVEGAR